MRILYADDDGSMSFIVPAPGCDIPINEIARKDVPAGKDFWIVEDNELPDPEDEFRDAWELDLEALGTPDGQGIGAEAWFAEQEVTNEN